MALKHDLPIAIHSRKSLNEILSILNKYKGKGLTGVFHCFPGNIQDAQKVIDLGFYLGIGGVVTYKNAGMAEVVRHFDLKHILLETDSPFLAPSPHRGALNTPAQVANIARFVAEIRGESVDYICDRVTENALRFFGSFE